MSLNYKYNKKTKKNCHPNMKPRWNHVEPTNSQKKINNSGTYRVFVFVRPRLSLDNIVESHMSLTSGIVPK